MQLLVLLVSLLVTTISCSFVPEKTWENVKYERTINLAKSYLRENIQLEIKNIDTKPNNEYYLAFPSYVFDKLSIYTVSSADNAKTLDSELVEEETLINGEPLIKYIKLSLPHPIAPKQTFAASVNLILTDSIEPLPQKIELGEPQTLLLKSFKLPVSAYKTSSGSKLKIIGVEEADELSLNDKTNEFEGYVEKETLNFDFDVEVEPFKLTAFNLLYKHDLPLPKATTLDRGVWISHWGSSIQFEEFYKLTNKAAQLAKGFSRADFMLKKLAVQTTSSLVAIELGLPQNARDIYYTDLVGNVSHSKPVNHKLYIKPRFPIYGGWNYNFTIGWTNSLSDFIRTIGKDEYLVAVPLVNGPLDTTYGEVRLSFYLPEGAEILEVSSPIPYDHAEEDFEKSYLDLAAGHTKKTLVYKNLIDELTNLEVIVRYKYTTWDFIKKPLNVAKFVFVALLSYLAISKIDLSLSKSAKKN